MNMSVIVGALLAVVTLWLGVFRSVSSPMFYLDSHALILVFGGTMAVTMIAFPFRKLLGLFDSVVTWYTRKRVADHTVVEELYEMAMQFEKYRNLGQTMVFSHPFMAEGFKFVISKDYSNDQIQEILGKRIVAFRKKMQNDGKTLLAISKFPPAFGLLGASTGMIAMMISLGGGGGTQKIGGSMAIALVATFWGIGLANLVFLPLADFAHRVAQDETHTRLIIMEGLMLIRKNEKPHVIVEVLMSHLHPKERRKVQVLNELPHDQLNSDVEEAS